MQRNVNSPPRCRAAPCVDRPQRAKRPGVFEVEASVTLDDGTAQADCWLTGDAALALTPPNVKNAILPIVQNTVA